MNKEKNSPRKNYEKPKIIFSKKIELLASTCNSNYTGPTSDCRTLVEACTTTRL